MSKSGCDKKEVRKTKSIELPVIGNGSMQRTEIRTSRTSLWRAFALIMLQILMAIHFIQWWMMGTTVSPIEPSETMYTLQNGAINAGFIFFALAILATLVFGRFVCGWGCHIVALQDFCAWLLKKAGLVPKPFRSRVLVYIPVAAALYMFVWPSLLRYFTKPATEPLIPQFTNHLITTEFWATFPPLAVAIPFLFVCGFVTVYFLGSKGFCTYACPYGGFFGLADKLAPGKIRVTDACNQCGHCTATCTSNVIVHAEVKRFGMVVDPGCMKCMDCVSVCPNDALYFGFGKPSAAVSGKIERNYSLTWPEEMAGVVIFIGSYHAVWDVYQLVPMLMALGIAIVTTFLALRCWRLITSTELSFYRFNLKAGGTLKAAGWAFLLFSILWIGVTAHSGFIRYHESAGNRVFETVRIPDELALAQSDPVQWLSQADKSNIGEGISHFETAGKFGFFVNVPSLPKYAWLQFLSGNADRSAKLLDLAAVAQEGEGRALSHYYRGAILNRLGRYDEARTSLNEAMQERDDLMAAREEFGVSLWQLGEKREAFDVWRGAINRNPALPIANSFLAGAESQLGENDGSAYEQQADRYTPNDPYFHWMLALRLEELGMKEPAEKHFRRAIELDPRFRVRRGR